MPVITIGEDMILSSVLSKVRVYIVTSSYYAIQLKHPSLVNHLSCFISRNLGSRETVWSMLYRTSGRILPDQLLLQSMSVRTNL